ncbi:MAG TPA: hypothetical protein VGM20_13855 [Gemmatimonadales bacterium]
MPKPTRQQIRQLSIFYVVVLIGAARWRPQTLPGTVFALIVVFVIVPCLVLNRVSAAGH